MYIYLSIKIIYIYLNIYTHVHVLSRVWLFVTPWTVAHQAPLSMGFSRQEHWSGLPFPPPGDLPDVGMEPTSPASQVNSSLLSHPGSIFLRSCSFSSHQRLFFQGYLTRPAWVALDESSNLRVLESVTKFSNKSLPRPKENVQCLVHKCMSLGTGS